MSTSKYLYPAELKAEARALKQERADKNKTISHSQALELVAKSHGFKDWNTASALLAETMVCPVQIGERVSGEYLKQPFVGTVLGTQALHGGTLFRCNIHFDEPVDVVTFDSFSAFRQRVLCRVDAKGISPDKTGDGQPHMRLHTDMRRNRIA